MDDYSFTEKIKFVPTLCSRTSPAEYYDWEDAMEDFLHDRCSSPPELIRLKYDYLLGVIPHFKRTNPEGMSDTPVGC